MFGNKKYRDFYVKLNGYGYKTLDILSEIPYDFFLVRYDYFAELCQTVTQKTTYFPIRLWNNPYAGMKTIRCR